MQNSDLKTTVYTCFEGDREQWCQFGNQKLQTLNLEEAERFVAEKPERRWMSSFTIEATIS